MAQRTKGPGGRLGDEDQGEHLFEVRHHRRVRIRDGMAEHMAEVAVEHMTGGENVDFDDIEESEDGLGERTEDELGGSEE